MHTQISMMNSKLPECHPWYYNKHKERGQAAKLMYNDDEMLIPPGNQSQSNWMEKDRAQSAEEEELSDIDFIQAHDMPRRVVARHTPSVTSFLSLSGTDNK